MSGCPWQLVMWIQQAAFLKGVFILPYLFWTSELFKWRVPSTVFSWNNIVAFHHVPGTWRVPGPRVWWGDCLLSTCCLPRTEGVAFWIKPVESDASYDSPAAQEENVVLSSIDVSKYPTSLKKNRNGVRWQWDRTQKYVSFHDLCLLCKCCAPWVPDRNIETAKPVAMRMRRFLPLARSFSVCFGLAQEGNAAVQGSRLTSGVWPSTWRYLWCRALPSLFSSYLLRVLPWRTSLSFFPKDVKYNAFSSSSFRVNSLLFCVYLIFSLLMWNHEIIYTYYRKYVKFAQLSFKVWGLPFSDFRLPWTVTSQKSILKE